MVTIEPNSVMVSTIYCVLLDGVVLRAPAAIYLDYGTMVVISVQGVIVHVVIACRTIYTSFIAPYNCDSVPAVKSIVASRCVKANFVVLPDVEIVRLVRAIPNVTARYRDVITSADHESHGISRGHTADITLYRDTIYHYPGGVIRVHAADLHSDKSTILDTPADHIVESHTVTAVKIGIGMLSVTLNGNISKKNI